MKPQLPQANCVARPLSWMACTTEPRDHLVMIS